MSLVDLARDYAGLKLDLIRSSGLSDSILHIHAGLILFVLAALASRRGFGTLLPIAIVLLAACANEGVDRIAHGSWRSDNSLHDLAYTLAWPLILFLAARFGRLRR